MKRKIFTLLLSAFFGTMAMAQAPNVIIKKATVAPIIDGVVDDVWAAASKQNIDKPFQAEIPTLGDAGTTTWKALWNDDGIFLLLEVNDDEFYPAYMTTIADNSDWKYDKPEIYFDVNAEKKDGVGGGGGKGHYQFAPGFVEATIDGTLIDDGANGQHAFKVTGSTYKAEYFFPFTKFLDKDGSPIDITQPIGFDVTIIDGESAAPGIRQRAVWANVGAINESYSNMDDCGTITLSSWDNATIDKATAAPVLDGVIDDIWASATAYPIYKPFQAETPTLGETTWQALWNDDGIFLLLKVTDDEFYPAYMNNNDADWKYDKPEIYFDVNAEKKDGLGSGSGQGHYQFAPGFAEATIDGTLIDDGDNGMHAFKVTGSNYVAEYFFPFSIFVDKNGAEVNITQPIGFDVTIIDGESAAPGVRQRAVWSNVGAINESYSNMDDCALVLLGGAAAIVDYEDYVESIAVTGGSITTDNGTLQMVAAVEPSTANPNVKWVVENGTGRAKISSKGILTGIVDGAVLVKAIAKDGTNVEGKTTVTISGQITTLEESNIIKNSEFELGPDGKELWGGSGTVEDSWYKLVCTPKINIWDTMFGQRNLPISNSETPYTLKFKAVATADMTVPILFEDRNNDNNKAVSSISEYRDNVYGKWDIPVTTEAKWYTIEVIFSAWVANSAYELNFQLGLAEGTFSIDSIYMFSVEPILIDGVKTLSNVNKVQLWPNPVHTELTVSKIAVSNSKVSVYNAVGQKLIEKTANGTQAKFDVANLRKGMYFVRFSDGSSQKFIKQ